MSDKTPRMTEAELAEYYDRTRDLSEFDQSASFPVEVPRDVTISVRFSAEEIQALRREAEAAGVKVTAYIRAAALQASSPVDRKRLQEALRAVSEDVAEVQRLLTKA
jgi:predicted DNA binding CopG/RHH family protein